MAHKLLQLKQILLNLLPYYAQPLGFDPVSQQAASVTQVTKLGLYKNLVPIGELSSGQLVVLQSSPP